MILKRVLLCFFICSLLVPELVSAGSYLNGVEITPPGGWHTVSQNNSTAPPEFIDALDGKRPGTKQLILSGRAAIFTVLNPAKISSQVKKGSNISLMFSAPVVRSKDDLEAKAKSACPEMERDFRNKGNTLTECRIQRTSRYPYWFVFSHNAEGQTIYQALFVISSEKSLVVTGTLAEERPGAFQSTWNDMLDSISF